MVTQMFAIPDDDGIIRVSCGNAELEIHIVPASPARGGGDPPDSAAERLKKMLQQFSIGTPGNSPIAWICDPRRTADGKIDTEQFHETARLQLADPGKPDPLAILLSAKEVNLHEINHIGESLAEASPNLSLAVDFAGRFKR